MNHHHTGSVRARSIHGALALLAAAALAGCGSASRLEPAPGTPTTSRNHHAAVATVAGVRMTVEPSAWVGQPMTLDQMVTPMRVTIANRGRRPLRLRYEDITLTGSGGFTGAAIPPYRIDANQDLVAGRPALVPRFSSSRFHLAPDYWRYYPTMPRWNDPWAHESIYYDRYYPSWTTSLPTLDMLEQALPEGVLQAGGRVPGFVYFPRLGPEVTGTEFRAELVDARSGTSLGTIRVPFVIG